MMRCDGGLLQGERNGCTRDKFNITQFAQMHAFGALRGLFRARHVEVGGNSLGAPDGISRHV